MKTTLTLRVGSYSKDRRRLSVAVMAKMPMKVPMPAIRQNCQGCPWIHTQTQSSHVTDGVMHVRPALDTETETATDTETWPCAQRSSQGNSYRVLFLLHAQTHSHANIHKHRTEKRKLWETWGMRASGWPRNFWRYFDQ
eukprot:3713075-Rhodomonas_salina.2